MINHRKTRFLPLTFTLGSRSYKGLTSTIYIISSMHLQSLKLLRPIVKEEMHLQENNMTMTFGSRSHINVAKYPPHHITHTPAKFEVSMSNDLREDALTRK